MDTTIVKMVDGVNFNKSGQEIIPCKFCNAETTMLGTELCDPCWELDSRIRNSPDKAGLLVTYYKKNPKADTPTREELFNGS